MNNLFSVKNESNLIGLLKKFNHQIIVIFIFNFSCETSKNLYLSFINTTKTLKQCIFVLLNTEDYKSNEKFTKIPELRCCFDSNIMYQYYCKNNDSLPKILPEIYDKLVQIINKKIDNSHTLNQVENKKKIINEEFDNSIVDTDANTINPLINSADKKEKIAESRDEKIKKILQLRDILNKMYIDELQKLTIMKDLHRKLNNQNI